MNIFLQILSITMLEAICCRIFFYTFLPRKESLKQWTERLLMIAMILGFAFITLLQHTNYILKSIGILSIITGIAHINYKSKFIHKLFLAVMYYGLLLGIDFFEIVLLKNFAPLLYHHLLVYTTQSAFLILSCKTVLLLVIVFIRQKWNKEDEISLISELKWIYLLPFPTLTIIIFLLMTFGFEIDENSKMVNALLFLAFCLVVMNFILFYVIQNILNKEMQIRRATLLYERTKSQLDLYYKFKDIYEKQKNESHDYHQHLDCLQGMLKNGDFEEAIKYTSNLTGKLYKDPHILCTNNIVVDTVINQKYRTAKDKDITIITVLSDLSQLLLKEEDIVIILSNLLDNAIEACEKLECNKEIIFKFVDEEKELLIYVENPINEPVTIKNNKIITTKKDKINHGIGILNITSIVEKYNGVSISRCENGCFYYSATIPHEKEI